MQLPDRRFVRLLGSILVTSTVRIACWAREVAILAMAFYQRLPKHCVSYLQAKGKMRIAMTGATNFSVNGLYINANHVLVFGDATVAQHYAQVFEESWSILSTHTTPSAVASGAFASNSPEPGPQKFCRRIGVLRPGC
jgi:hypothetical protein